jgi:putative flavoprotein involved in K+ transport
MTRGRPRDAVIDCAVVGAGPAGLAASAALSRRGVEHVILERGRVGQSWREQRWDCLRLNNPGWMNPMLGEQAPDTYLLAAACPVREGLRVARLAPHGDRWTLLTGDGELRARSVVVASGGENLPRLPGLARALSGRVAQYHAADYRNPGQLPDGAVLVVGSAQSGCQIAEDLLAAGRQVILATSPVGRAPARHRGRDTVEWLVECGFFRQRPQDLPDPSVMAAPQPLLAPGGRSMSLQVLARAGVTLAGRLVAAHGEQVTFDDSAPANVAAGDAFAARIRMMLDQAIRRAGLQAPPVEPDDADTPVGLNPPMTIDLRSIPVGSVVWCTGYTGDFSWLPPASSTPRAGHNTATAPPRCPVSGTSGCAGSPTAPPGTSSGSPPTRPPPPTPWLPTSRKPPSPPWRQLRGDLLRHVGGLDEQGHRRTIDGLSARW